MKMHSNVLVAGAAALAITAATAAVASGQSDHHEITLQLPGGGTERIEYTGEAPQVVFDRVPPAWPWEATDFWATPAFANLEKISADMDRQMDALFKEEQAVLANAPRLDEATLSPGTVSTTWVSTSSGNKVCARVTQISEPAQGGKPQILSRETGDCSPKSATTPIVDSPSTSHDGGVTQAGLKTRKAESKPAVL